MCYFHDTASVISVHIKYTECRKVSGGFMAEPNIPIENVIVHSLFIHIDCAIFLPSRAVDFEMYLEPFESAVQSARGSRL